MDDIHIYIYKLYEKKASIFYVKLLKILIIIKLRCIRSVYVFQQTVDVPNERNERQNKLKKEKKKRK